jgi:hypothetical protein
MYDIFVGIAGPILIQQRQRAAIPKIMREIHTTFVGTPKKFKLKFVVVKFPIKLLFEILNTLAGMH